MICNSVKLHAIFKMAWLTLLLVSLPSRMETDALSVIGTVDGKTYYKEPTYMIWKEAKQLCEEAGMHLASITTTEQLQFLYDSRDMTIGGHWLGGRDALTPAQFVWDHNKVSLNTSLFPYFSAVGIETCVSYTAPDNYPLPRLSFMPCTLKNQVVCETYALNELGTVDGKTYYYEEVATNWTTAKQMCERAGMHLASVTFSEQLELLKNLTMESDFWIGAHDARTTAQFVWDHNNGSLSTSLFPNFIFETIQTCVTYWRDTTIELLISRTCKESAYVLCEIIH